MGTANITVNILTITVQQRVEVENMSLLVKKHSFHPLNSVIMLLFGLLLMILSAPGLLSLLHTRSASKLVKQLASSQQGIPTKRLLVASEQYEAASQTEPGRRQFYEDRASVLLALYYRYRSAGRKGDARLVLQKVARTLETSLRFAPANANLWYLIAETRALQGKMDGTAKRFLAMSYITGPREGWIALRRLQFSLRYWLLLDEELRRYVRREIRTLWSDTSYTSTFLRLFSKRSKRAQTVIASEIDQLGSAERLRFDKASKRAGWK